jgi:hypothetical protein
MYQLFRYTIFPFFLLLKHYLIIRKRIRSHLENIILLFSLMSFVLKKKESNQSTHQLVQAHPARESLMDRMHLTRIH